MINKLIKPAILGLVITLSACSTEDEIPSTVTFYPLIELNGESTIFVEEGEAYTEPGVVATIDGEEVPYTVTYTGRYRGNVYTGDLDTAVSDVYTVTYSAENADGFFGTNSRQVIVAKTGDLENSIAGLYTSTVFRNGSQGAPASAYTDIEYILIWENEDGTYGISDSFGGWYLFGRAIADSETPGTVIVANDIATDDFSFPGTQSNAYFGGTSETTGIIVDAENNTLDVTTVWQADQATTYTFTFTLTQVQF